MGNSVQLSRTYCFLSSAALLALLMSGCGGGSAPTPSGSAPPAQDDTAAVQSAVDKGGIVSFAARTYYLSRTIVISQSNTTIQGSGPQTVFQFRASATRQHCLNDRAFTTPCGIDDNPPRRIANAIAVGDPSFSAVAAPDVADIQPGDWLLVSDIDDVIGDRVTADWVQVASVTGVVVSVTVPFRTAFSSARTWDPGHSGLGFQRISPLVQNIAFRNFTVAVPDAGPGTLAVGISVFNALHTVIDHVVANSFSAQPLYSYLSKDLTVTSSQGLGHGTLNEFAATVDATFHDNHFSVDSAAGFGLDLGTAFFDVSDNSIDESSNIGAYILYGVHDGSFAGNQIAYVSTTAGGQSAYGILVWGSQNISVSGNYLAGGAGPDSTGMSVRSISGEIPMPSAAVSLVSNSFGSGWVLDYAPGTQPAN
jgi:hypothetical protein